MRKKRKTIKAKWEWINSPDAEERLQAAFDIIFRKVEEPRTGNFPSPADANPESDVTHGQLPLF